MDGVTSSQSSSSESTVLGWHPSQLVFAPYVSQPETADKSQTLRVAVRRPGKELRNELLEERKLYQMLYPDRC